LNLFVLFIIVFVFQIKQVVRSYFHELRLDYFIFIIETEFSFRFSLSCLRTWIIGLWFGPNAQRSAAWPVGRNSMKLDIFYAISKNSAALPLGRRPSPLQRMVGPCMQIEE
jgi:hypothetical protein